MWLSTLDSAQHKEWDVLFLHENMLLKATHISHTTFAPHVTIIVQWSYAAVKLALYTPPEPMIQFSSILASLYCRASSILKNSFFKYILWHRTHTSHARISIKLFSSFRRKKRKLPHDFHKLLTFASQSKHIIHSRILTVVLIARISEKNRLLHAQISSYTFP